MTPDPDDQPPDGGDVDEGRWNYRPGTPLSREEDGVLDDIEHGLAESDPGLAARISQLGDPPPLPLAARCAGGLSLGVMVLVFASTLPAAVAWVLLLVVAVAVVLPSLLPDDTEPRPRS